MMIAVKQLLTPEINRPTCDLRNELGAVHQFDRQHSITNPKTRSSSS